MRSTRDERDARAHFDDRYRVKGNAAAAAVEQAVIGAVWGANGYTTRDQADELDIPRPEASSGGGSTMSPGGVFVVEGAVSEAAVEDAHESVGERS